MVKEVGGLVLQHICTSVPWKKSHQIHTWTLTYPRTTEATQPVWVCVVSIIQLDVVITAVGFFLHLKRYKAELNAIALFSGQQPLTVCVTRVVIISKLGMGVKVFLTGFCFQTTSTLLKKEKNYFDVQIGTKDSIIIRICWYNESIS